jgi:hypothetical protein
MHKLPADFERAIKSDQKVKALWPTLTPLARNEWICWVISVKTPETREKHIRVGLDKMRKGMRRPCCWSGCIHRADKPMSRSQKWVMSRKGK